MSKRESELQSPELKDSILHDSFYMQPKIGSRDDKKEVNTLRTKSNERSPIILKPLNRDITQDLSPNKHGKPFAFAEAVEIATRE